MKINHQQIWNISIFDQSPTKYDFDECLHIFPHPEGEQRKELAETLKFMVKELEKDKPWKT